MGEVKAGQFGGCDSTLQFLVVKLGHRAALGADLVMMRVAVVTFFVLGRVAKLVLDNQAGIDEQDDGVVKRSAAHAEILLVCHERIERFHVKMTVDGVDGIEYSVAFGSLAMPVRVEIFGEYLLHCIFHILTFHACSDTP